jgi:hypothetical protein
VQRGELHLNPFGIGQRSGQFLERDVRLCPHDVEKKIEMRGQLAKPARGPALPLRNNSALRSILELCPKVGDGLK